MKPRSVVVIGASPEGRGFTSAPLKNLKQHGFGGSVYAVNPKYDDIGGIPCYRSLSELPVVPDTAVVVVGAERVPAALNDCAQFGVKSATVIAGGFAELGPRGAILEQEVRATCSTSGLRLVGPNTAGLLNVIDGYVPRAGLNHPAHLEPGSVAIATQSGALSNTLLNRATAYGQGIAMAVATGSQWDLNLWDFVEYFLDDSRIHAVLAIPEGIHDAAKFLAAARRAAHLGKPIVLLKPGRSERGSKAVQTHSGALSGAADVQVSIMRSNGVIVVDELDELWEVGQLFSAWPVDTVSPSAVGRLGVLTYSGGDGALAVDEADQVGLSCPDPTPQTAAMLSEQFTLASPGNPFDYTGEIVSKPELIGPATRSFLDDDSFDVVLVAAPVWSGHFAEWILGPAVEAASAGPRPAAVSLWSAGDHTVDAQKLIRESGLPLFDGSHRAVRAIGGYFEFIRSRNRLLNEEPAGGHLAARSAIPGRMLEYWESRGILETSGIPFNQARAVTDVDAASDAASEMGFPLTLKVSSASAVHKAAAGGVRLFVPDVASLRSEATEMFEAFPGAKVVVERFMPGALMALVGGHCDPEFGPVIVFGLGGGYAEAYHDVAHLQCPASQAQVTAALASTKFGNMLRPESDTFARVAKTVFDASQWFARASDIRSFDVNPILIGLDGQLVAVDARVEVVD